MDILPILIVVSLIAFLLIIWVIFGVRWLERSNYDIYGKWILMKELLNKRYGLVSLLVWIVQKYKDDQGELLEGLIDTKEAAIGIKDLTEDKIRLELELSKLINNAIFLGMVVKDLINDGYFLEIKTDIDNLEEEIEKIENEYNVFVDRYNRDLKSFIYLPIKFIFRYREAINFDFES